MGVGAKLAGLFLVAVAVATCQTSFQTGRDNISIALSVLTQPGCTTSSPFANSE